MSASNSRAVAIKIDQETRDRVERLANARQRTPHGMMTEAIQQYLDREEKREQFRQDSLDAWKECQTTGMHAEADELTAWVESWGSEDELPAPNCHK